MPCTGTIYLPDLPLNKLLACRFKALLVGATASTTKPWVSCEGCLFRPCPESPGGGVAAGDRARLRQHPCLEDAAHVQAPPAAFLLSDNSHVPESGLRIKNHAEEHSLT